MLCPAVQFFLENPEILKVIEVGTLKKCVSIIMNGKEFQSHNGNNFLKYLQKAIINIFRIDVNIFSVLTSITIKISGIPEKQRLLGIACLNALRMV